MHRQHSFNTLDFHDQALFDNEIDPIRRFELNAFVDDRQPHFVFEVEAGFGELV
jgi:hypothetical protein